MKLLGLDEFINESAVVDVRSYNKKLNNAADVICRFINKKTGKDYKKYPFTVQHVINGKPLYGIMFYSNKDDSAFRVTESGNRFSIVGSLEYYSDHYSEKVDIQISSDSFPIVKLLNEFILLISNKSYNKSISESFINESLYESAVIDDSVKDKIENLLNTNISAKQISRDLGLPYRKILKVKRNINTKEVDSPIEKKNTLALEDRVKILDETLADVYEISRRVGAGAFNSLFISGRAGTGKTYNVEKALKDEGLQEDDDYVIISGAASVIMIYIKMYQFNGKTLVFDDCDSVFKDEAGRNLLKAALDTKPVRKISYMKRTNMLYDPKEFENKPEEEFNALESGLVPNRFDFTGRIIFISNLDKKKADPDGAISSRSILVDVNPDDATLMERIRLLLPHLEPTEMPLNEKEEIFEFIKNSRDVTMRTFVKAAGFKMAGLKNWKRMTERYL